MQGTERLIDSAWRFHSALRVSSSSGPATTSAAAARLRVGAAAAPANAASPGRVEMFRMNNLNVTAEGPSRPLSMQGSSRRPARCRGGSPM